MDTPSFLFGGICCRFYHIEIHTSSTAVCVFCNNNTKKNNNSIPPGIPAYQA